MDLKLSRSEKEVKRWKKSRLLVQKSAFQITDVKPFIPSYERTCEPISMWELMCNKYRKRWMDERDFEYNMRKAIGNNGWCSRRVVLRDKKPESKKILPVITLKRFANVLGKVDTNLGLPHAEESDEGEQEGEPADI